MSLFAYSHSKAAKLVVGIIFLMLLFPTLFRIVFAAKEEISYSAGVGVSTCGDFFIDEPSELSTCTTSFDVAVGNTGSIHQSLVILDLTPMPADWRLSWSVLDIVATERRPIGPRVVEQQLGDALHFEIEDLEPNRMVQVSILGRGIESHTQLQKLRASIQAKGTIVEADPRLTVTLRFIRNLGGIFGF